MLKLDKILQCTDKWDQVFKNRPSKFCGRQPLKNLLGLFVNTSSQMMMIVFQRASEVRLNLTYINPFPATGLLLYPLKTSENLWFSDVFREGGIERDQWHEAG